MNDLIDTMQKDALRVVLNKLGVAKRLAGQDIRCGDYITALSHFDDLEQHIKQQLNEVKE